MAGPASATPSSAKTQGFVLMKFASFPCFENISEPLLQREQSAAACRWFRCWTKISPMSVRRMAEPSVIMDAEERFEGFENLMPFKVHNILLVSSLYDSFILREDGRLNELLIDQSLDLSLQQIPGITHVSSWAEAAALARTQQFNLIVTNLAVGDTNAAQLASEVKQAGLDVPFILLGYDSREIKKFVARNPVTDLARVFLWQGNAPILVAIVKYLEDKPNLLHDTRAMVLPVLLIVV